MARILLYLLFFLLSLTCKSGLCGDNEKNTYNSEKFFKPLLKINFHKSLNNEHFFSGIILANNSSQKGESEQQSIDISELFLKIKILQISLVFTVLLILISLLIIFIIHKKWKIRISEAYLEQKTLSLQIENKDKELTTNLMYLLRKNEFLAELTESLKELNDKPTCANKQFVSRIIREVENNTYNDSWEEFEKRFQEVHVDFYKNLCIDFPNITPNELKLSAFLKLNMSSKDISSITMQSVDSLKVARYRLRKKLGLEKEKNLVSFLAKY